MVAQADGLLDGLEADAVIGKAGDRKGARDGAGGEDELVVRDLDGTGAVLARGERGDGGRALGVIDAPGLPDDEGAVLQDPAQRHDDVARRDGTGGGFGEERLIGHIWVGGDDDDLRLTASQPLLQLPLETQRGVHPDIAPTDDENAHTRRGAGGCSPGI